MLAVDLFDRLVLETAPAISLEVDDATLPTGEDNLVVRAAQLLRSASGEDRGVKVRLRKRIPVAAGLGGGSSDAAATLWGLNRLWNLRWPAERVAELAVEIGMDVPFFLTPGAALATGRGERIERLRETGGYAMVLVNPGISVPTRDVYAGVPAGWSAESTGTRRLVEALR